MERYWSWRDERGVFVYQGGYPEEVSRFLLDLALDQRPTTGHACVDFIIHNKNRAHFIDLSFNLLLDMLYEG